MGKIIYPEFGVLLVDDEPDWLSSLALTLTSCAGLSNISTCSDSRQVMAILDRGRIGLVLLDLTMPHLSGEELLGQIAKRHPEIVAIAVSDLNQLGTAQRCMRQGAFDYFLKTDDQDRLIGGVLRAVRMLELQRDRREMASRLNAPETRHPFAGFKDLPSFSDSAAFLVLEAMERAGGNQTAAARLLGISQPALSKRLKMIKG